MTLSKGMLSLVRQTLRLEHMSNGRTLLEPAHCPDHFLAQEIFGINVYLDGELTVYAEDQPYRVPDNAVLIIPAGSPRRFTNLNPGRTISVWNGLQFTIMDTIDPLSLLNVPAVLGRELGPEVERINREAIENQAAVASFLKHALNHHSLALDLLDIILEVSELKPDAETILIRADRLQPALQYIKENLNSTIRISDLASIIHVSEPRFFELFRDALGMAPGRYIQKQRMRRAQGLLVSSALQISQICDEIGYEDQFHFSRLFKKNFGVSPVTFRRQWSLGDEEKGMVISTIPSTHRRSSSSESARQSSASSRGALTAPRRRSNWLDEGQQ